MSAPYSVFKTFNWETQTAVTVVNAYLVFLSVFSLYQLLHKRREFPRERQPRFPGKERVTRLIYAYFLFSGPLLAVLYYQQAMVIRHLGYGSYYNGAAAAAFGGGAVFSLLRLTFTVAFFMICTLENQEQRFTRASLLYLLVVGVQLIQGSRGEFIVAFLAVMYIRQRVFGKDLHPAILVLAVLVGIPGIYLIACLRSGTLSGFRYFDSFRYLFVSMSASVNVAAFYLQNRDALPQGAYPYILDPIVRLVQVGIHPHIYSAGQSTAMVAIRHNLGHQITYFMSHAYYLKGANVGSSFIAELLEFGIPGVILGSALFTKLVSFFDERFCSVLFFRFMAVEFVGKIMFEPRAEFFYDTYNLFKYGLIFTAVWFVCEGLFRYYYKENNHPGEPLFVISLLRKKERARETRDIAVFQKGIDNRNKVTGQTLSRSRSAKLLLYYAAVLVASPKCRRSVQSVQYVSSIGVRDWNFDCGADAFIYRGFCYRSWKELFALYTFFAPFSLGERFGIVNRAIASYWPRRREIGLFSCWLEFCILRSFFARMQLRQVMTRGHYDEITTWMGEFSREDGFDLCIYQHGVVLRSVTIPHRVYCSAFYGFDNYSLETFRTNYIANPRCRYEVYPFGPSVSFERLPEEKGVFRAAIAEQYNREWTEQTIRLIHQSLPEAEIFLMLHPLSQNSYREMPGVTEEGQKKYINVDLLVTDSSTLAIDYYRADRDLPVIYTSPRARECFGDYPFVFADSTDALRREILRIRTETHHG